MANLKVVTELQQALTVHLGLQDAGFMAYFHMTGEKPVDLSIVRSRLLPGTSQVCGSCALHNLWPIAR